MAGIKFAFVACAFLLPCLFLNGCAQQYEAEGVEYQSNNWQATRSRLRGRGGIRSVDSSSRQISDNSSPDIAARSRQRVRGRNVPDPHGEEFYKYETLNDPTLVERSFNPKSRSNIKSLEDSLNTEKYQKRVERLQRRNGVIEATEVPFTRQQKDEGTAAKRLEGIRSGTFVERNNDFVTFQDSKPRGRGRSTSREDVTTEAKPGRTRGFRSRYQGVEPTRSTRREFYVQAEQVKQDLRSTLPTVEILETDQPQQTVFTQSSLAHSSQQIPGSKVQQVGTTFFNVSHSELSIDPAQQFSRRSDSPTISTNTFSNQQLPTSRDIQEQEPGRTANRRVEQTIQLDPTQIQNVKSRGRVTYQTTQEGSLNAVTESRSKSRQNSFRSRTRVVETTTPYATLSSRSKAVSQTRNISRTFRGKPLEETERQTNDRVVTGDQQAEPLKPAKSSRSTARDTKSEDEIDESANYPREFLEKLKSSKAYPSSSKVTFRSKRRQTPTTIIPSTKLDSDTSETNTKEMHEESSTERSRYSQRFYKKLSQRTDKTTEESFKLEETEPAVTERRKFVPKKRLSVQERKERISRLKEKLKKNTKEDEVKAEESKESVVKESLVTQANTHPGSREVFPTEKVKSTVEVKSSVSSNVKRVKKSRGQTKFRDDNKDLIPLASEEQFVIFKNETTTKKSATTKKPTSTKKPPSTTRLPRTVTTTTRPPATTPTTASTTKGDFAILNVTLFPSTRHRFSARINSSATLSLPPDVELITTTTPATALSTPEALPSLEVKPEFSLSVNKLFNTTVNDTNSSTASTRSTFSTTTTTRTTTRRSNSKKKSSGKKKTKKSKSNRTTTKKPKSSTPSTTTVRPASNSTGVRPLTLAFSDIESIINETVKIVNNNSMTGPSAGVVPRSELNALTPETILNGTTEATMRMSDAPTTTAWANTNSSVNSTNKIELSARLTDLECSNGSCTKSKSQSVYFNEDNSNREPIPYARQKGTTKSPETLRKIFIYGVFPNNTVQRKPFPGDGDRSPDRLYLRPTTSLPPYTSGDYFVFGVYPNNSVVRRRGWKTFDYEKYHSPYVIFGIYPNNTIIKKFPNGTTINDGFMVSDNDISRNNGKIYCTCTDPGHQSVTPHIPQTTTTTTTTTTTIATTTTTTTTTTAKTTTTEASDEGNEEKKNDEEDEEEEEEEDEEKEEKENENEEKEQEEKNNEDEGEEEVDDDEISPERNPKEEVENVNIESENISETEGPPQQTTEESTDMPSTETAPTTPRTLKEAEEADLFSTTTESDRLENAEQADDASTPNNFDDSTVSSLEREETQNKGLEDAEEADLKESDSLSVTEDADDRTTTERSLTNEDESEQENPIYSNEKNENENLEERVEENENLREATTESTTEESGNANRIEADVTTTERYEDVSERYSKENEEEDTEKPETFEEENLELTSEKNENFEEVTTRKNFEEDVTEDQKVLEEKTDNYFSESKTTERSDNTVESTQRSERLKETTEESESSRDETTDTLEEEQVIFGTTERTENLEKPTEGNLYDSITVDGETGDFGTTKRNEEYEQSTAGYFYELTTTEKNEPEKQFETTESSENVREDTERYNFDSRAKGQSEKLEERTTDAYELTTERSENTENQTSPELFEISTTEKSESMAEQTNLEEQIEERYEGENAIERVTESVTTEKSAKLQSQETDTESEFSGDLLETDSPGSSLTTEKPFANTQNTESTPTEGSFDSNDRITGQANTEKLRDTLVLNSAPRTTQRPDENTIPVEVIYEGYTDYRAETESVLNKTRDEDEARAVKNVLATTERPDENTIPVKVIYEGYTYEKPTGNPFTFEDAIVKGDDHVGGTKTIESATTSQVETTTEDATESATVDYDIDVRELGNLISRLTTAMFGESTPPTDSTEAASSRETTADLLEALLPLSIEYIQASASGNEVKKRHRKSLNDFDEPSSLTNLAYRSLSSWETTSTAIPILTTTSTTTTTTKTTAKVSTSTPATRFKPKKLKNYSKTTVTAYKHLTNLTSTPRLDDVFIVTPVGSTRGNPDVDFVKRGKVKFVTLTPGVVVTTNIHDENDILTMSSQHVQKVTKAPAKIPDNFLSTVFGELEEKASSPIPDILKNVENDLQGDGLSASLARRIITLALEKAMTSTTPVASVAPESVTTTTKSYSLTTTSTSTEQPTLAPLRIFTLESAAAPTTAATTTTTTTRKSTTTKKPVFVTTKSPTTIKPVTSTTRRPRTTSKTTPSATEQTREILITPKKTQGQVSKKPAPLIANPEFLLSTAGPEINDGRTGLEVPLPLEPLNVLFASDKLSSTTVATLNTERPTEDSSVLLPGLLREQSSSSSKVSENLNLVTQRQKSSKEKTPLPKQASNALSESDLKILEAILQQQGVGGKGQDLEQIVQNQIRLAEEVRKASRNLRKKPRTTTTTTTTERPTPLALGFLLNLLGSGSRPNGPGLFANEVRNSRRQRPTTPSTLITLTNTSQASPDPFNELDNEGTATGERSVRGELVSAAIDVTKAVSKFMGTVLSSAAQSFQNFFRNLGR